MKLNILKEDKETIQVELEDEGHTFANALKEELYEDKNVKSAAYLVEHPLILKPQIIVRVDKGRTPKAALKNAASRLGKRAKEFKTKFKP